MAELGLELRSLNLSQVLDSSPSAMLPASHPPVWSQAQASSCLAPGSQLASWIPNARMVLAASESLRAQVKGKFLVPPTTTEPSLGLGPRTLHLYLH